MAYDNTVFLLTFGYNEKKVFSQYIVHGARGWWKQWYNMLLAIQPHDVRKLQKISRGIQLQLVMCYLCCSMEPG